MNSDQMAYGLAALFIICTTISGIAMQCAPKPCTPKADTQMSATEWDKKMATE